MTMHESLMIRLQPFPPALGRSVRRVIRQGCLLLLTVALGLLIAPRSAIAQAAELDLPPESLLTDPAFARAGYGGVNAPFALRTRYLLALDLDANRNLLIGKARILYVNNTGRNQDQLVVRLYANHPVHTNRKMTVTSASVNGVAATGLILDNSQTVLTIPLGGAVLPNDGARIDINYTITLPGTSFYYLAEPYPIVAVYDQTGWRVEVASKGLDYAYTESASHAIRLRAPADVLTWFNGAVKSQTATADGRTVFDIVTGPVRNVVLVQGRGWQSSQFSGANVPINVIYAGNPTSAQQTAEIAVAAFNYYEKSFGAYPYASFDIVSMNFPSGGEEYPALVFINNQRDQRYRRFIVAHEVGHQWFYNLAGNDTMRHAWLDESLTQIAGYLFYKQTGYADAEAYWQSILTWANRRVSARPIDTPLAQFASFEDYMSTTYGAGPVFFRELSEQIGEAAFVAGLRTYVTQAYLGIGTPEQFFVAIQAQTAVNLRPLFCQRVGIMC